MWMGIRGQTLSSITCWTMTQCSLISCRAHCWEYPIVSNILPEQPFLQNMAQGNSQYYSGLLISTVLSLGCRFSDRTEAQTNSADSNTAGNHFFEEAKRSLAEDEISRLTTVQALSLMSMREASCVIYLAKGSRLTKPPTTTAY